MGYAGFIHHNESLVTGMLSMTMNRLVGPGFRYASSPEYRTGRDEPADARQFAQDWINRFQQQRGTQNVLVFLEANLAAKGSGMSFDDAFLAANPNVSFVLYHNSPDNISTDAQNLFLTNHGNILAFDTVIGLVQAPTNVLATALANARTNGNLAVVNAFRNEGPVDFKPVPGEKIAQSKGDGEGTTPEARTDPAQGGEQPETSTSDTMLLPQRKSVSVNIAPTLESRPPEGNPFGQGIGGERGPIPERDAEAKPRIK